MSKNTQKSAVSNVGSQKPATGQQFLSPNEVSQKAIKCQLTSVRSALLNDNSHFGLSSANDTDSAISTDHHNPSKSYKHKAKRYWNTRRKNPCSQDSESESAPLLSSDSNGSPTESIMFCNSETSELDSSYNKSCTRYGSTAAACLNNPDRLNNPSHVEAEKLDTLHIHKCCDLHHHVDMISLPMKDDVEVSNLLDVLPKQNSLVTIFSIWNTILGASLLTVPWGIMMAGLIPGMLLMLCMSGLCLYTAYRLLQVHKYHGGHDKMEVPELCRIFLGPLAEFSAKVFSVTVLLGATIAYWILMSNCLYNSVNFIYDKIVGYDVYPHLQNDSRPPEVLCPKEIPYNATEVLAEKTFDNLGPMWDLYKTVPFFLGLIMFPLLNFNSTTFFTKFNSLGTIAIGYVTFLVLFKASQWGVNMNGFPWETSWRLKSTFPALCGMLALSFFIHNIVITIMRHNRHQHNNGRDLTIAYMLVTLTYVVIGVAFYISFPLAKSCIEDNFLNNFQKWDVLTVGARIVLFFQLLTVYPLMTYMLRIRILATICSSSTAPKSIVVLVNLAVVVICMIFARFLPYVGTVIRYTGAISGLVYVFTLPSLLHLVILQKKGEARTLSVILHLIIPFVGVANLIAQLFVTSY